MIEESGTNFDIIAGTTDHGGRMRTIPNSTTVLPPLTAIQWVLTEQCRIAEEALVPVKEEE